MSKHTLVTYTNELPASSLISPLSLPSLLVVSAILIFSCFFFGTNFTSERFFKTKLSRGWFRAQDRHTDIQTFRYSDIQTYRHTDIQTERQPSTKFIDMFQKGTIRHSRVKHKVR